MRTPTRSSRRTATLTAAVAGAALVLAACSSSSDSAIDPTADPSGSASSTVTPGEVGGDPGTWTPLQVSIKMKNITVDMRVGQVAQFVEFPASPDGYTVVSKDDNVAKATSSTDADAVFGFVAEGVGQTEVSVYTGTDTDAKPVYTVKVNVPNLDGGTAPAPAESASATPDAASPEAVPGPADPASPATEDTPAE